jgi:hypothetical protein
LKEIDDNILYKLGELLTCFYDIELKIENILDNLIVIKLYNEIIINLLVNLEYPAKVILVLLKFDQQIYKINEKYKNFYLTNNCENDEKITRAYNNYLKFYNKLIGITEKFKIKIEEEGANTKFTQDSEVNKNILNNLFI